MKVWVVSFGGVGCSYTLAQLAKSKISTNHQDDSDGLKHLYSPVSTKYSEQIDKVDKIIYIYNDPLLAILSHIKRGWLFEQHRKITGAKITGNPAVLTDDVCKNYIDFEKHTLAMNNDQFGCSIHFEQWYNYEHKKPILFIDFRDKTFEHQIQTFINTPVKFELKQRTSNKNRCKADIIAVYDDIDTGIKTKIQLLRNHS